jgi:hypothetical protein
LASVTAVLPARLRSVSRGPLLVAAAAPVALLVVRLLPAEGAGLVLRLGVAAVCLLLLPGALVLRPWAGSDDPALAVATSLAASLALAFAAFAITFAVGASLNVTLALLAAAALAGAAVAATKPVVTLDRRDRVALAGVLAAGMVFAGIVWWSSVELGTGDVLFHLARARKLAEADTLSSVAVANEFRDGGLHSGYAFPLWHGVLAGVARLAGVDVTLVALQLSAVLVPLAFLVAYAAGTALFRSRVGGLAALAFQAAQLGFSRGGTGSFASLALPSSFTRLVLFPALLALVFAYVRDRDRRLLLPLAAAALAIAVIHPTYLIFAGIVLAGFALVWLAVAEERKALLAPFGLGAGAVLVPAVLFFLWLLPVVTTTASHQPSAGEKARALAHYGEQLETVGDGYRAAPETITRTGPVVVAGLAVLPLLALALVRSRVWAAFAVGGSLLVLAILLIPDLFTRLSDLVSISQSRRLAQFLPIPFALAGAAVVFGRIRLAGALAALGAGVALELLYEAELTHTVERGGPIWPLWAAIIGTPLVLIAALVLRRRLWILDFSPSGWAALPAIAFVLPIAVAGLADLDRRDRPDPDALSPGVVTELRALDPDSVVFAPVETSYRVAAFAPVYVAASPPPHVADTEENRPYERQRDAIRFFAPAASGDAERLRILEEYGADWLLVDKTRDYPRDFVARLQPAYEDERYALYRVAAA